MQKLALVLAHLPILILNPFAACILCVGDYGCCVAGDRVHLHSPVQRPSCDERTGAYFAEQAQSRAACANPSFQGTIVLELLEQVREMVHSRDGAPLAAVVVPLGGGGMLSGIAMAVKVLPPPSAKLRSVHLFVCPSIHCLLLLRLPVVFCHLPSFPVCCLCCH